MGFGSESKGFDCGSNGLRLRGKPTSTLAGEISRSYDSWMVVGAP
jgi:hypothetical protein